MPDAAVEMPEYDIAAGRARVEGLGYSIVRETPSVADYLRLRAMAGLGAKSEDGVARGLANTLFAVQLVHGGRTIGMTRVIGDDGLNYVACDGAVEPEHQAAGLGRLMLAECVKYFRDTAPPGGYLMALTAVPKYTFPVGFRQVGAEEVGIYIWKPVDGDG